jgi:hypothetical protein
MFMRFRRQQLTTRPEAVKRSPKFSIGLEITTASIFAERHPAFWVYSGVDIGHCADRTICLRFQGCTIDSTSNCFNVHASKPQQMCIVFDHKSSHEMLSADSSWPWQCRSDMPPDVNKQ